MTAKQRRSLWGMAIVVAIVAVMCGGFALAKSTFNLEEVVGAAGIESPSASPSPSPSPSASADKKGNDFVIDMPKRGPDGQLNANGVTKRGNTEAFRAQILEQAKRDPLTLFLYYQASPLGETDPLKSESVIAKGGKIENGNVYSKRGIRAYEEWAVLWKVADINATEEVTHQGANTGVDGTKPTYSKGVHGKDKSGFDIAYLDAEGDVIVEHSALNRCGQPTTDSPPRNVKPGNTDNPPPPKKEPRPEKPKPPTHEPTPTPTPPPETGKDHTKAPAEAKEKVVTCKTGYYKPRGSNYCVKDTPPAQNDPPVQDKPSGEEPGKGDSGEGATDTTTPPPTTQPPAEVTPVQPTPTTNPEMP